MTMKKFPGANATQFLECSIRRIPPPVANQADGAGDDQEEIYEISASNDAEVTIRYPGGRYRLQISHEKGAIDLKRFKSGRAALLFNHDPDKHLGVIRGAELEQSDKRSTIRTSCIFGPSPFAQEKKADVDAEVLVSASIGINPIDYKLVEEDEQKGDLWVVTKSEALELSLCTIPRNMTVGVGLGEGGPTAEPVPDPDKEDAMSMKHRNHVEGGAVAAAAATQAVSPAAAATVTEPAATAHGKLSEGDIATLFSIGRDHHVPEQVQTWITKGLTPAQVVLQLYQARNTVGTGQPGAESLSEGLSDEDLSEYSYTNIINMLMNGGEFTGVEGEMHQSLIAKGYRPRKNGCLVPLRLFDQPRHFERVASRHAMTTGGVHVGAELVRHEPMELIEALNNNTVAIKLGATVLPGMTGRPEWTKETGEPTVTWRGEMPTTPIAPSDPHFDILRAVEKPLTGQMKYSRALAQVSTIDNENFTRNRLAGATGRAIDRGVINGTGTADQPLGILRTPGVNTHDIVDSGGKVVRTDITKMILKTAKKNADFGKRGWLTTLDMAGDFSDRLESEVAGAQYMWRGTFEDGQLRNYPAVGSNQMPADIGPSTDWHGLLFGMWDSIVVIMFGVLEIIVDQTTMAALGYPEQILVTSYQMVDSVCLYPEGFTAARGAKPQ